MLHASTSRHVRYPPSLRFPFPVRSPNLARRPYARPLFRRNTGAPSSTGRGGRLCPRADTAQLPLLVNVMVLSGGPGLSEWPAFRVQWQGHSEW